MPTATIQLLGGFALETTKGQARLPMQAQRVLAYLAICDRRVRREDLSGRLWPFTRQAGAQGNLRTALWRIRKESPEVLQSGPAGVALHDSVSVDYRALLDTTTCESDNDELLLRLRHDLLPGWDEEWLTIERERTRQLRMRRLEALSRKWVVAGEIDLALSAAFASLDVEPLRESAHLVLIEAHLADGNQAEAVRHVHHVVKLFDVELGVAPSSTFWQRLQEVELPFVAHRFPSG